MKKGNKRDMNRFIVCVDRSIKPIYFSDAKGPKYLRYECSGLGRYHLSAVQIFLHQKQKFGLITGHEIFSYLKENKMLKDCLNLQDALLIEQKGVEVFKKFFKEFDAVFFWKSVVKVRENELFVPYLSRDVEEINIAWFSLDEKFNTYHAAALISPSS